MINALMIDKNDNVATTIEKVGRGDMIDYQDDGEFNETKALTEIPIYHKFATKDIKKGEPVVKYGQHIGIAAVDINKGEHVHVHNVESHRENLGAQEELV